MYTNANTLFTRLLSFYYTALHITTAKCPEQGREEKFHLRVVLLGEPQLANMTTVDRHTSSA
jgi:hypothetical protein